MRLDWSGEAYGLVFGHSLFYCCYRQMKEKEEEYKKKEEEKARREQEEEHEKDEKLRIAKEKLRKQKEEHLDELLKMDLDSSSIRELKAIMVKMGVSTVGCLSKQDLKEKLFDQVPELRIRRPGYNPKPRSHNTSMSGKQHICMGLCCTWFTAIIL